MIAVKPNIRGLYAVFDCKHRVTPWLEKHTAMAYAQDLKFEKKLEKRLSVSGIAEYDKKIKKERKEKYK